MRSVVLLNDVLERVSRYGWLGVADILLTLRLLLEEVVLVLLLALSEDRLLNVLHVGPLVLALLLTEPIGGGLLVSLEFSTMVMNDLIELLVYAVLEPAGLSQLAADDLSRPELAHYLVGHIARDCVDFLLRSHREFRRETAFGRARNAVAGVASRVAGARLVIATRAVACVQQGIAELFA